MNENRFRLGDLVALHDEIAVVTRISGEELEAECVSISGFYWANGEWWWYASHSVWDLEIASGRVVR